LASANAGKLGPCPPGPADELDAGPVLLRRWRLADADVLNRLVTDN
jgi:hypothetical protein